MHENTSLLNSVLTTDQRVAHISLVFREMWETTASNLQFLALQRLPSRDPRLPHLAKNERDMGHPLVRGEEKSQSRLLNASSHADSLAPARPSQER